MRKVYLIHGWGGSPKSEAWFPWLRKKLSEKDLELEILEMPNTEHPRISEWVGHLEKNCKVDENTYFIGHSIGCQTIMRFLEKLPKDKKIAGVAFIAGWFNLLETAWVAEDEEGIAEEKAIARPWLEPKINFEKVKSHTKNFLAIFSTDDPCVPISDSKIFKEKLGAKIIIKEGEEHFNDTKEIQEILDIII